MLKIIERDRSVIPACDVDLEIFEDIVENTHNIEGIGGYKIGPALTGRPGYDRVVEVAWEYTDKPLIYDGQKLGTDIPDTSESILTPIRDSGIDAVILFPQSGPVTAYEWIKTAQELNLGVIVGGEMTHPRYGEGDFSNGKDVNYTEIFGELMGRDINGFMRFGSSDDIYELAARMKVSDFVVPGNKPDRISHYRSLIERCGVSEPAFYSPGLVTQGGDISEGAKAAGKRFHAIVGRGIYKANDIRQAALEHTSQL